MKQFTITFENDAHCEAIARRRGWTPAVKNPLYVPLDQLPREEREAALKNPVPEFIPNPETPQQHLCKLVCGEYEQDLRAIAADIAADELRASTEAKVNAYLADKVTATAK